ncbi:MAG: hypothetical protein UR30_C0019G0002 [Candidatus Peregrinibacteria bacterium GW2011_GWC2_33_13]|nr:MAG: hypothetical protein UR30_C0019G0002 [Candidatus Peregrinibacteria bacterium GW2011_GWC2_33_13]
MTEKQIYNLQIDKNFKQLIPPLAQNEYEQLEENIVRDGCREPLCVWRNTIIDGHNRYEICSRLKIPFYLQEVEFNSEEDSVAWICANQLGRRNISEETRRYLIGKRYEMEKKIGATNLSGKNQHYIKEVGAQIEHQPQMQESKEKTAERIGKEYNLTEGTIRRYGKYAKSIDILAKKEPELISEILTGKIKISKDNVSKLAKQSSEVVNNVKNQLNSNNSDFVNYYKVRKVIPVKKEKITVKNMPVYDPDAEISSLSLTIPSWISSIDRTLAMADFNKTSHKAMKKLKGELKELKYTVDAMLLVIEEK